MNRAAKLLLASLLVLVVAGSGCVFPEMNAIENVKADPRVSSFLAEHPNAETSVVPWPKEVSEQRIDELREKCGYSVLSTDYFYVSFKEGNALAEAWIFQKTLKVACVHRSDDQCVTDAGCDDGIVCTKDVCEGMPKQCVKSRVKECIGGDGCCPTGCSYSVDYDCEPDECTKDADCDDRKNSTEDYCSGLPRVCGHREITQCREGDSYCPAGCNFANDRDCETGECGSDANCDDGDPKTRDYCSGEPPLCMHSATTECVDHDGVCPRTCYYKTDSDCDATPGDKQRVIVECNGISTNIDNDLMSYSGDLKALFADFVTHANNDALKFYDYKKYKYNNIETQNTGRETGNFNTIVERITVNGNAVYDRALKKNFFYFSKNGLEYEVELNSGVPAIESATNPVPFISDNKDRIPIVLFGTDSLVRYVNQNEGKKEVQLISDYIELSVTDRGSAKNLEGKTGKTYTMKIARCDEGSAIFSLYNGDTLVASQEAKPGDMLFTSELKKAVMLTYLNRDYSHGRCEFRYAIGAYLEKIYDGKEFPVGSGSGWTSYLEFGNNKLKRIVFKREGLSEEGPIEAGQSIGILPAGETEGNGFCSLKFFGVVR